MFRSCCFRVLFALVSHGLHLINWQVVGVPDKAEKDEIVKSVMQLKNAQVEEGYTMDAVMSRQVGNRDWNLWFS